MATTEEFKVKVSASGLENLDKVTKGAESARAKIEGLSGAILGIGFAAFIHGAMEMADRLSDLADATGIGIDKIKGFEGALGAAGGKSRNTERSILAFVQAIETANDGSLKVRDAFAAVGVSLSDLRNLSEQDLLLKTIEGLKQMDEGSQRTAIQAVLLSKAFRGVDAKKFFDEFVEGTANAAELAESMRIAGEQVDRLEKTFRTFQEGALIAIQPVLEAFGGVELKAQTAAKIVTALGVALGLAFGVSMLAKILAINEAILATAVVSNLLGKNPLFKILANIALAAGMGGVAWGAYELAISEAEKSQKKLAESVKDTDKVMQQSGKGPAKRTQEMDPRQEAVKESNKRIAQYEADLARTRFGIAAGVLDEIAQINLNAEQEIAKAKADIDSKKYLSEAQKAKEFAAQRVAIEGKAEMDILKIKEENAKRFRQSLGDLQINNDLKAQALATEQEILGKTALRADFIKANNDLEKENLNSIKELYRMTNVSGAERAKQEAAINEKYAEGREIIKQTFDFRKSVQDSFAAGAIDKIRQIEDQFTSFKQAGMMVDSVFNNMTSALDKFVDTGKFKFSDFARSVINDLIKIQLKAQLTQLLSNVGGMFGFGGGKALGGPVTSGTPYVVGEKGPELFIPSGAGSIVPNSKLADGTAMSSGASNVTYNIQAVDAMSFKQMLARDPSFLYAVSQQGARSVPMNGR
jgi:lambda family phage tail tape measure protein